MGPSFRWIGDGLSSAALAVKKIRRLTDMETARLVYFSYFHSIMSYGILLWSNAAGIKYIFNRIKLFDFFDSNGNRTTIYSQSPSHFAAIVSFIAPDGLSEFLVDLFMNE